jgi:hypothetical protein
MSAEYSSVNTYTAYGHVSKNAVHSSGELSRLKSRMGIRVSGASRGSEFIIISKLKRAIHSAIAHADEKRRVTYDRLTSKLDRLSLEELEWLHYLLGEQGFDYMITQIQIKATSIRKMAMKWKNSLLKELSEGDGSDIDLDPISHEVAY